MKRYLLNALLIVLLLPLGAHAASVGISQSIQLNQALVGYWTFDGKDTNWNTGQTSDRSGNAFTGQLIGMSTSTTPVIGTIGQSLFFGGHGSGNFVSVADNSLLDLTGDWTVSVWYKANSIVANDTYLSKGSGSVELSFGATGYNLVKEGVTLIISNVGTWKLNKWTHLLMERSGNNWSIYENGVLVNTTSSATAISDTVTAMTIGKNIATAGRDYNGSLDDFRIYTRALSTTEIIDLYKQGSALVNNSQSTQLNSGLIGYWTFDGKDTNWNTNTTRDVSGNAKTGTMVSLSTTTVPTIGIIGQSFTFNGGTGYVATTAFTPPAAAMSISVRFKTKSTSVSFMGWNNNVTCTSGIDDRELYLDSSGKATFRIFSGSPLTFASNAALNDGLWHTVIVTVGTNTQMYVDGVLQTATAAATGGYNSYTTPFMCIAKVDTGSLPTIGRMNGSLDDVRIYNRTLSATEVVVLTKQAQATIAHSNAQITSGLVGYWTFDGPSTNWNTNTTADRSGGGFTGTLTSMSTTTTPTLGKIGQGLNFSSALSQYVNIAGLTANTAFIDATFTVSAWVKTTTATFQVIAAKENTTGWDFDTDCASTGTGFTCARGKGSAGSNSIERRGLRNIADGKWHLFTAVYTLSSVGTAGQDIQMYTDGVLDQGPVTNSAASISVADPVNIGRRAVGTYFNGQMDDVRLYNRALTPQEVQVLYNSGR